jgi:glycine cleavage system H protein
MPEFLETTIDKFIFRVAADRLYSCDGVWVLARGEGGPVELGLTDYVQQRSGDVAFVHLKPAGTRLPSGDEFAEVETIKATLSVAAPLAGEIVEVNPALEPSPEKVNEDPYGNGWLVRMQPADWQAGRANLLDPQAYFALMRTQAEEELKGA